MRRRLLLVGVGLVGLLCVGFALFVWLTTPTPGVTWENYRRLRIGMSARDVKALLGARYLRVVGSAISDNEYLIEEREEVCETLGGTRCWRGEELAIYLTFDEADRLTSGEAFRGQVARHGIPLLTDETFLDRIRRLLPW